MKGCDAGRRRGPQRSNKCRPLESRMAATTIATGETNAEHPSGRCLCRDFEYELREITPSATVKRATVLLQFGLLVSSSFCKRCGSAAYLYPLKVGPQLCVTTVLRRNRKQVSAYRVQQQAYNNSARFCGCGALDEHHPFALVWLLL